MNFTDSNTDLNTDLSKWTMTFGLLTFFDNVKELVISWFFYRKRVFYLEFHPLKEILAVWFRKKIINHDNYEFWFNFFAFFHPKSSYFMTLFIPVAFTGNILLRWNTNTNNCMRLYNEIAFVSQNGFWIGILSLFWTFLQNSLSPYCQDLT